LVREFAFFQFSTGFRIDEREAFTPASATLTDGFSSNVSPLALPKPRSRTLKFRSHSVWHALLVNQARAKAFFDGSLNFNQFFKVFFN
jgi:hypothetical protein